MFFRKKKIQRQRGSLTPDEIFLDAENIHDFSRERFEGVIERPLSANSFYAFGIILLLCAAILFGRTFWLSVVRGAELKNRAENNYIEKVYIDSPRGIIYDRKGLPLVENEAFVNEKGKIEYRRLVRHAQAFSHVVGFVGTSKDDSKKSGQSGLEFFYNERLGGVPGEYSQELDASGVVFSEGLVKKSEPGSDVYTTLDAVLQETLWFNLERTMRERGFRGGAGIIFSVKDGSILALASVPSFDINALVRKLTKEQAEKLFNDKRAPLFNRAIAGTYAPGSIIKPFLALAALEEGIITPERNIFSSGALTLPNPYDPLHPSVFRDWRAHGYVDMRKAIAVSSDVYFYVVGGGFGDIKGLGIEKIKSWLTRFGLTQKTDVDLFGEKVGLLPDPEWKKIAHKNNPVWRVGDTYHVSIGQGDVLVTPIGIARAISVLAQNGISPRFHLTKDTQGVSTTMVSGADANWRVVREGMEKSVAEGTASSLSWAPFSIAGKTGTAEIGYAKDRVNSWFMGYMPAEDPQLGMVIMLESGPRLNTIGGTSVASEVVRWIVDHGGIESLLN